MTITELIDAYVLESMTHAAAGVVRAPEIIMSKLDDVRTEHRHELVRRLAVVDKFVRMGAVPEQLAAAWNGDES